MQQIAPAVFSIVEVEPRRALHDLLPISDDAKDCSVSAAQCKAGARHASVTFASNRADGGRTGGLTICNAGHFLESTARTAIDGLELAWTRLWPAQSWAMTRTARARSITSCSPGCLHRFAQQDIEEKGAWCRRRQFVAHGCLHRRRPRARGRRGGLIATPGGDNVFQLARHRAGRCVSYHATVSSIT